MKNVIALILGGGRGGRLYPLTQQRAKPAVPVAGKYRLIDLTLSNCINSGIKRVFVLTQFLSESLHRHIMQAWQFDTFTEGFVQILAAEQTHRDNIWYQGTGDAVREALRHFQHYRAEAIVILSGDHLYRMDYGAMVDHHFRQGAQVTVAVHPVPYEDAPRMGLLRVAPDSTVLEVKEKPKDDEVIERFRRDAPAANGSPLYTASMGIYVYDPDVLAESLADRTRMDFGKEIIPSAVGTYRMSAFEFDGYWQDIGTIRAFFDAHIGMTLPEPTLDLVAPGWPVFTRARNLPPARFIESEVRNCLVAEGADIRGARLSDSVIGVRSIVRPGCVLDRVVMLGADFYDGDTIVRVPSGRGPVPPLGIGRGSQLSQAIVDKNARIGENVVITPKKRGVDIDGPGWWVRDGITIVPKNAVIPDGTWI